MALVVRIYSRKTSLTSTDYCSRTYRNNIGHRSYSDSLCYPVIDAVYIWTNRSDPDWLKRRRSYLHFETEKTEEDPSANRVRDDEDLKYSLRSLEKNAPWIHKVFIVTDGQTPAWLNTRHPKIEVVQHSQIFTDPSVLPTFSTSSIELNLHHIPGLSESFIYLKDNMLFGQPVYPYHFYTIENGNILYYSWNVPDCSDGCRLPSFRSSLGSYSQLGDGTCDRQCYTERCQYDFGDCKNEPMEEMIERIAPVTKKPSSTKDRCNEGCPFLWIGDGSCDRMCNVEECGFDAYDCMKDESDLFDSVFVRFVCLSTSLDTHPVFDFLRASFPDHATPTRDTLCLSRVIVPAEGSFISLNLKDLTRLGYKVESIEILNDGACGDGG